MTWVTRALSAAWPRLVCGRFATVAAAAGIGLSGEPSGGSRCGFGEQFWVSGRGCRRSCMGGPHWARGIWWRWHLVGSSHSACWCGRMTAGPDGKRGSGSKHCGAIAGAMTRRSVPTQVLTILPSLPCAPCRVTGRKRLRPGSGISRRSRLSVVGPVGDAPRYPSGSRGLSQRCGTASPRRCARSWRPGRGPRP